MSEAARELTTRGVHLAREQKLPEAIECFEQAIRVDPRCALAYRNLGYARELQGDTKAALSCYGRALEFNPQDVETLKHTGELLFKTGDAFRAAECFKRACALAPTSAAAFNNLGVAMARLNRHAEATGAFRRAVELNPTSAIVHSGLGASLTAIGAYEEGEKCLLRAIQLDPRESSGYSNLGIVYKNMGRLDEALRQYDRAIELKADYPEAQKARALCLLLRGDFLAGWPGYEWRERMGDLRYVHPLPRWRGEPLKNRTVLIETEQGLGDTIQFIRYAAEIKRRFQARIIIACEPQLVALLTTAPGIDVLIAQDQPRPAFHVWTPLMSVPGIFQDTLETVPAAVPYLRAEPARVEKWRQNLHAEFRTQNSETEQSASQHSAFSILNSEFRPLLIGIAWQGNPENTNNANRSFPLAAFAQIAAIRGVSLISLQKGAGSEQTATAPFAVHTLGKDFDAQGGAFLDTAAVMMNLDLIITADTSIAHLAGALSRPVWVPLPYIPDWRWSMHGEQTPWYPTMRLFRQPARGQWQPVFERLAAEVEALAGSEHRT